MMNPKMNFAMIDAARLTRMGQLSEATELLQRTLKQGLSNQPDRSRPSNVTEGAQFIAGSYSNAAGARAYKLYVPSSYHGQPLPLIVMLHGGTQAPDDFAIGTRMNNIAEQKSCFVVYPAQPMSANFAKCWNWFNTSDQKRDRGEPSIIAGITHSVCESHAVDHQRIYIAGMSAGGAMAMTMAINYPELYAAVGVHSGLPHASASDLPSAMSLMSQGPHAPLGRSATDHTPSKPIRAIVFHGDRDTTVHPANGMEVVKQCTGPQTSTQTVIEKGRVPDGSSFTRSIHFDPDGKVLVEHWLVHGAGHAWSGGSAQGSYTHPRGPDATSEMVRFFFETE